MELYKGKFYKNGKVVPVEIGNIEQINVLQELESLQEQLIEDGIELDIKEDGDTEDEETTLYSIDFKCLCGVRQDEEIEGDANDFGAELFDSERIKCYHCHRKYVLEEINNNLYLKLEE